MELQNLLPYLFILNAIIHFIQAGANGINKKTTPVGLFGVLFLVLGVLWMQPTISWLGWVSLIFSVLGIIGLTTQLKDKRKAKWTDYGMLVIDAFTILVLISVVFNLF